MEEIIKKYKILNKLKQDFIGNIQFFYVIDYGKNTFIVTKDDEVYTFGSNNDGVLGFGHSDYVKEFTINEELSHKQIIDFKNGLEHTIARTSDGKVYCWGQNLDGLLGNGRLEPTRIEYSNRYDYLEDDRNNRKIYENLSRKSENRRYVPKIYKPELNQYLNGKNVVDICCSICHSLVLTIDGDVYAWGENYYSQIGNGKSNNHELVPYHVKGFDGQKVKAISCGSYHSMALTEAGNVFGWGCNDYGQLGIGTKENCNSPKRIKLEVVVQKICCGQWHSLLLSLEGEIYVFGRNDCGQLGMDVKNVPQLTPKKLVHSNKFIDIASHRCFSISTALSENGSFFVWGEYGDEKICTPKETHFNSFHEIFAKYCKITHERFGKPTIPAIAKPNALKNEVAKSRIYDRVLSLFNDPKYSDLKFKIEDKHIFVHILILRTFSKHFERKFTESSKDLRESTENRRIINEIEVKQYSYDVYYAFLKYIYTDCVEIETEKAIDLLVLANDYNEEELKQKCVDIIKNDITLENVCSIFSASIKYNLKEFEDYCLEFAVNNMDQVSKTQSFRLMDANSMKQLVIKAADKNVFKR